MPPKQSGGAEDAGGKLGIVTCLEGEYIGESRLAFIVKARLALVFDRKSVDDGQVIGMVCENDIVCASHMELPWIMLPMGSNVRHPKVREGRIRLQRDGWLVTRHSDYGELMTPFGADKVRRAFEEDSFAKLPVVKAKAKAKASAAAPKEVTGSSRRDAMEAARREEQERLEKAEAARQEAEERMMEQARREAEAQAALAEADAMRRREEDLRSKEVAFRAKAKSSAKAAPASLAKAPAPPGADAMAVPPADSGRPPASQFLPLARGPNAEATAAAMKAAVKKLAVAKAKEAAPAKGKEPSKAMADRIKAPAESFDAHLRMCTGEHWKVVHDFVFLRAKASTSADQISIMRRGACFCLAALPGANGLDTRSQDGKWVKCSKDAKVWPRVEATEPEFLLQGNLSSLMGFVLIRNDDHGDLLRLVPNYAHQDGIAPSKDALKLLEARAKEEAKPPPVDLEPKAEPTTLEAVAKMHHWVVEQGTRAHALRDDSATVDAELQEGDVITVGGASWVRTWSDISGKKWLLFPPGGQVYRKLQAVYPVGGNKKSTYILVQDAETVLAREYTPPETGVTVSLVSGYGEPWIVEHDQVVVRRGPSTTDVPVGIMVKGDVVGVMKKQGDWVQLMQDSDVRFRKKGSAGTDASTTFLSMVNSVRQTKVEEAVVKKRREHGGDPLPAPGDPRGEPPIEAWMLVEHPTLKHLLRRARKRKSGLSNGVVLGKARSDLYKEVVEICHRRIYEENLEGLWDGERDKLPTVESIENKLFDSQSSVLHVTSAGKFCGGAIIKSVPVRAKQVEGSSNLNLTGHSASGDSEERLGRTMIGYVDSCAALSGTGGGRMIWDVVSSMPFVCVTCHSILLQKTVDFWQACGMRRMDPTKETDCDEFKRAVLAHTMGKVICELTDLEKDLPSSKLPLFVWVPSRFSQVSVDPHSDYIFTPDDGEGYYL